MNSRTFARVRPCKRCPFRTDVHPYLTPERVEEIATDVQGGSPFWCHETTALSDDEDDAEMVATPDSSVCAGSIILMEKAGTPNQHLRIAERLGQYDPSKMRLDSPVHDSWVAMQQHFAGDEEGETCEVVGPYCEAPAGYAIGGGIVAGTTYVDTQCSECYRYCCESCMTDGICDECRDGR